ncbi:hypothetical protein PG994_000532 [Apiospora phragmitis]|uniref:Uncharacterized protein n=1 Tax=Apiospora phragmitis TaxID=2905665 RepID=A0ABR1X6M8_9PEZI
MLLPRCCDKLDEERFNDMCLNCRTPAEVELGKPYRCSRECRKRIPLLDTQDPQTKFDDFVTEYWPVAYRTRYERQRDERKLPREVCGWASSFTGR